MLINSHYFEDTLFSIDYFLRKAIHYEIELVKLMNKVLLFRPAEIYLDYESCHHKDNPILFAMNGNKCNKKLKKGIKVD